MITKELEVEILRLHHAEHWRVGTIASQLKVHHTTVKRVLAQEGTGVPQRKRSKKTDPFIPLINEMLDKYPKLTAVRLFEMVKSRGYVGQISQLRAAVAKERGRHNSEPFLRLRTLPGEQAQVDWAHFGRLEFGKAKRPLMAFVIVLSHSRAIFLHFFLSQNLPNFLRGHELAFEYFGGVPRVCLYDNLKSVVVERVGKAIRFNEQFLNFAGHYRLEPRPVAIARGNEKGRVERAIRYIRDNFYAARKFTNLADLNHQALNWCQTNALARCWPDDHTQKVGEVFLDEKAYLLPLPENPYPCEERREVAIGKSPYARFDLNDYSVPHTAVQRTVVIMASVDSLRILDGNTVVATHPRSYDRGRQIEDLTHLTKLEEAKAEAGQHRRTNLLTHNVPSASPLLQRIAERGLPLGQATKEMLSLLQTYGVSALEDACKEALLKDAPHTQAIRHILERIRKQQGKPPALSLPITDDPRVRNIVVRPHNLEGYDSLLNNSQTLEEEDEQQVTSR